MSAAKGDWQQERHYSDGDCRRDGHLADAELKPKLMETRVATRNKPAWSEALADRMSHPQLAMQNSPYASDSSSIVRARRMSVDPTRTCPNSSRKAAAAAISTLRSCRPTTSPVPTITSAELS